MNLNFPTHEAVNENEADYFVTQPCIEVVGDLEFEKFGFRYAFDFNYQNSKSSNSNSTSTVTYNTDSTTFTEALAFSVYYKIKETEKFTFDVGPFIGVMFMQSSTDYTYYNGRKDYKRESSYIVPVVGIASSTTFKASDKLSVFFGLDLKTDLANINIKQKIDGETPDHYQKKGFGTTRNLYIIPKVGFKVKLQD